MSVIILALGILMSATLGYYSTNNIKKRTFQTLEKFNQFDLALQNYLIANGRFPCPGPLNCDSNGCTSTLNTMGVERRDSAGNCVADNAAVFKNSSNILYGTIPAVSLGISNTNIADGWGNKIVYMIPEELTKENGFQKFLQNKYNSESLNYINGELLYVLISFAKNTAGAYSYNNKRSSYFTTSITENMPTSSFTVNADSKKYIISKKTPKQFSVKGLENEIQECPEIITTQTVEVDAANEDGDEVCQEFSYTGGVQTFTVPKGITQITMEVQGASGGVIKLKNYPGGVCKGGYAKGTLNVSPSTVLYVYVGGKGADYNETGGGYNGGGKSAATNPDYVGGGGGGATDIRTTINNLDSRIIVAGGGGGQGYCGSNSSECFSSSKYAKCGRGSGSITGITYASGNTFCLNAGAKNTTPGLACSASGLAITIVQGEDGRKAIGGNGGISTTGGGGGGGGYYGGGAGFGTESFYSTGGGGGNGYLHSLLTNTETANGSSTLETNGNGKARICYNAPAVSGPTIHNYTFKKAKYGEIRFAEEECPTKVSRPAKASDYYYISEYYATDSKTSADNRPAKRCGKNGKWESGYKYACVLAPKCTNPVSAFGSDFQNFNFPVVNMGEIVNVDGNLRFKCLYSKDRGLYWFKVN